MFINLRMERSMSEESRSNDPQRGRPLRPLERELIEKMLAGKHVEPELGAKLSSSLVVDMKDGGMGSILFLRSDQSARHFGKAIAEAEYTDEDGVLVSIVINLDKNGELFEVDFWKVDCSPLIRYPKVSELKIQS
jgi:hypothetical protein